MSSEGEHMREFIERELSWSGTFLVDAEDGTEVGVVDQVLLDDAGRPAQIEVTRGWFGRGRCTFDAAEVVAIYPSRRRLIVSNTSVARLHDPQA